VKQEFIKKVVGWSVGKAEGEYDEEGDRDGRYERS